MNDKTTLDRGVWPRRRRGDGCCAFGRQASAFLDYSANINPLGPPQGVITALQEGMSAVIRYPDPGHRRFKERLALS